MIAEKIIKSPALYLKVILKIIINLAIENPDIYLIRNSDENARNKANLLNKEGFKKKLSTKYSDVYSNISLGMKKNIYKKLNPEVISTSVISSVQGLISMIILNDSLSDKKRDEIIETTLEILLDGIKK